MSELEPTVFVVDRDLEVQRSIRRLLESVRLRVETYSTIEEFTDAYEPARPGCLILEVRMQNVSGIELHRRLRREGSRIPVIFLTEHADVPMAVQALREGAFHFMEKPFNEQYLLDQTQAAVTRSMRERREEAERRAAVVCFEDLSEREKQVLREIMAGRTNKAMARHLGIAVKTVEFHRANIMKKVGVESIVELVCLVLKSGWYTQSHENSSDSPRP